MQSQGNAFYGGALISSLWLAPCALRLCGECVCRDIHRRVAEHAENTQREFQIRALDPFYS